MEPNSTLTAEEILTHSAWLHRLAARLVNPSDADDVVQDTWIAAMRSPPSGAVRPWLAQVARNLARNRGRTAGRWRSRAERVRAADDVPLPTAEELVTYHETQRLVAELVASLEEPFRSTVLLCYGEGLAPAEVARRQGIPAGTVRWRLKRGLDEVRTRLDARYGQDRQRSIVALGPLAARALRAAPTPGRLAALVMAASLVMVAGLAAVLVATSARAPAPEVRPGEVSAARPPAPPPRLQPPGAPQPGTPPPVALAAAAPDPAALERATQVGASPTRGRPDAKVTAVVYTEFECPFCAQLAPTLDALAAAYPRDLRIVFKNLPLPFHDSAGLAAEAALAAHEQGKFWEMHDRLFKNQQALYPQALVEHARAIGLDVVKFQQALDSGKFRAAVREDAEAGRAAGITGTPTTIINGRVLQGAQPLGAFVKMIEEELAGARGGAVPVAGPPEPPAVREAAVAQALRLEGAPSLGDAKAPVTMVVFNDLQCPFCGSTAAAVDGLLAANAKELRVVFRSSSASPAAEALLAANEQGKWREMRDRLLATPDPERAAQSAGLDLARFHEAMASHRFRAAVAADAKVASDLGFVSMPGAVMNGRVYPGPMTPDQWTRTIAPEVARARGQTLPPPIGLIPPRHPGEPWHPPRLPALPDETLGPRFGTPLAVGDAPVLGNVRAPVTVLYLANTSCLGCGAARGLIAGLQASYGNDVRVVALPVVITGQAAMAGAETALPQALAEWLWAAHAQGKFWALHDKLFDQPARDRAALDSASAAVGLDVDQLRAAVDAGTYRARVEEDTRVVRANDPPSSQPFQVWPVFLVEGRLAASPAALSQLVDAALKKKGRPVPKRTGPALETNPAAPGYNARQLMGELSTAQMFALEPRDAAWAEAVEKELGPQARSDVSALGGSPAAVSFECHSAICRIRLPQGRPLATFLARVNGARPEPARPGQPAELFLDLRAQMPSRPAAEILTTVRHHRATVLYSLRTGRTEIAGVSPARVPAQ